MNKVQVLKAIINNGQYKLAFHSLMSAITSKSKLWALYKFFSRHRFKSCQDFLRKNIVSDVPQKKYYDNVSDNKAYENVIWTMWYQGYNQAPQVVRDAIDSKKIHSNGHKVIIIDKDNMESYVTVPAFMKEKVDSGIISLAHLSDYIRCELLRRYGGLWLDSTVFVVDEVPDSIFENTFWSIRWEKNRNWIASYDKWSVGVVASKPHSDVMEYCSECEYKYWERMNYPVTYLLLDMFIAIYYSSSEKFKEIVDSTPVNNTYIFQFVEEKAPLGNLLVNEFEYAMYRKDTWIFQLTYKVNYIRGVL